MPRSTRDEEFSAFVAEPHRPAIQAPTSLGWDNAQLGRFAAGVQVLHNAQPGHG